MHNNRFTLVLLLLGWEPVFPGVALGEACPKVVFVRDNQIISADADGSNTVKLTSDDTDKEDPKWSPDGHHIVYSSGTGVKFQWRLVVITESGRPIGEALI